MRTKEDSELRAYKPDGSYWYPVNPGIEVTVIRNPMHSFRWGLERAELA